MSGTLTPTKITANEIRPGIESVLGVTIPELDGPTRARLETLKDQAVDASVELSISANEPISIDQNLADDDDDDDDDPET